MSSFIYTLSIFVLVLTSGYFTLPIIDENVTTGEAVVNDQTTMSSQINTELTPNEPVEFTTNKPMEFTTSAPVEPTTNEPMESTTSVPVESTTSESMEFTTAKPIDERSAETIYHAFNDVYGAEPQSSTASEPVEFTTAKPIDEHSAEKIYHAFDDVYGTESQSFTTAEPVTQVVELKQRSFENKLEDETEEMPVQPTTADTSFSSSTDKTVSDTTEKYIGHYQDENENENENEIPKKNKYQTKAWQHSDIPMALYDQQIVLPKNSNILSGQMILQDNNDFPVTMATKKSLKPKEKVKLNQGEEPLHTEEKESDN